ncbi:Imm21 family immunity protein [Catellatospora sp. KI3]|uniref:Imm21 family immunity protein n=1 Tax=Catellatospora sp. KI3 TaxID=3041620 RepID=UPI0024826FEC|nr:Imm21 family immunity protein [Catellatospora sp. KI3]MDI1466105.1 Imm21 family immunity protein [Catellatospora sp. KI3]
MALTWITSAGGPLLVAPQSALASWAGVIDTDRPVETWGDYGRACAVDGYTGLIAIGDQEGLVLGDEPAMTTYLAEDRLFVRWAAAYDEDELVVAAGRLVQEDVNWDVSEELVWDVEGPVVLFDSAEPGADPEPGNHLVIDLEPGQYRVRATYRAEGHNQMILVQLQPTGHP